MEGGKATKRRPRQGRGGKEGEETGEGRPESDVEFLFYLVSVSRLLTNPSRWLSPCDDFFSTANNSTITIIYP